MDITIKKIAVYGNGSSKTTSNLLETVDQERLLIANKLGYKILSLHELLNKTYNISYKSIYDLFHNSEIVNKITRDGYRIPQ